MPSRPFSTLTHRVPAARRSRVVAALVIATSVAICQPRPAAAAPLPAAPVAAETFDVGTLHVERFGHGPRTIVLIPGLASGTWTWYGTIAHETATSTIYALTLPGFDGRPPSSDANLFEAFDRDFTALLATRNLARPIVIGHSLGGTLAIMEAERHPGALRAIVAVDGLPIFPMLARASAGDRAAAAARIAAPMQALGPDALAAFDRRYMAGIGTLDPTLVAPVADLQARSDARAEAAWMSEDLTTDLRPGLSAIDVPFAEIMPYAPPAAPTAPAAAPASAVATATAAASPAVASPVPVASAPTMEQTRAFYASLLSGAKTAQVLPVEPARHYAMLDAPEAFYGVLDGFLNALPI